MRISPSLARSSSAVALFGSAVSAILLFVPSKAPAQDLEYGMWNAFVYQDEFVTPMSVSSGSFAVGTLPGGVGYNFSGKSREQILNDFQVIPGSEATIEAAAPGQFYKFVPGAFSGISAGSQVFVFVSTGSTLAAGEWCLITGSDSNWLSPNPSDPFAYSSIELAIAGNRICAGTLGWRYRNGNQTADSSWADDLGFVTSPPVFTSSNSFTGTVGVAFSSTVTASGGVPITFQATNLPSGLAISTHGLITGTPTTEGTNFAILSASNAYGAAFQTNTFVITPAVGPSIFELRVRAHIDGPSQLIMSAEGIRWHHWDWTAVPGRHEGRDEPTYLNDVAWYPLWPQPGENRDYDVYSSYFTGFDITPFLSGEPVSLQLIRARDSVSVTRELAGNSSLAILNYDDLGWGGSDDYEVVLSVAEAQPPTFATNSVLFTGMVGLAFSNSLAATGSAPITFQATNLPSGLTISTTGVITGTPTAAGTNDATLIASNAFGVTNQTATFIIETPTQNTSLAFVQGGSLPVGSGLAGQAVPSFYIGKTEVTWAEWQEVRDWAISNGYTDLAGIGAGSGPDHPVRDVNWYDVLKWCNAASEAQGLVPAYQVNGVVFRTGDFGLTGSSAVAVNTGANGYRLPTEAEWEWAARGGANSQGCVYSGGNDLDAVAWYRSNSLGAVVPLTQLGRGTWPVKSKAPNELGLYDMNGNTWEWCWDTDSINRLIRGGSFVNNPFECEVGFRGYLAPPTDRGRWRDLGVRVVKTVLGAELQQVASITSPTTAVGRQGSAFGYLIMAGNGSTFYGASGLPPGLSVNPSTGLISGVPTQSGLFTVQLSASNAWGEGTATLCLGISSDHASAPVVTGPFSAIGYVGSPLSYAASADNNPTSFAACGLPPDVQLLAYGAFTGKPQSEGVYRSLIAASNAFGTGVAELLITVELEQPPAISTAFIDVGMVSAYIYTDNGNSPLLGGSFGFGYFGSPYDFTSKTREQILSDVTWMNGRLEQGGLIDAANPGQFYVDAFQSTIPSGTPLYAFLSTGPTIDSGNWFVLGGTPEGGWLAPDPDGLSSTVLDLGFVGNSILAGTSGWRFASGGPVSTGDESIIFEAPPDTIPPVIDLLGDNPLTVFRGAGFTDPGATVTDDVDPVRTIFGSGAVDTSVVATYVLTYVAQDAAGNAAETVTRAVDVVLDPAGDEDNDGLVNSEEESLGTNPYLRDTDSDGATDYREVGDATDPLNPNSFNPLSKGLVAYYPFDGTADDFSGNQHHGSLVGSFVAPDSPTGSGQSLHIDGSNNSWMAVADTPELRPAGTTISVWIYNDRFDNSDARFVCAKDGEQMEIHLGNPQNPQSGVRFIPINGCYVDTLSGTPVNEWYHLVCVAGEGSGGAKVYINGNKANVVQSGFSDGSAPLSLGTGPLFLGRRANGWSHLDGKMDSFRIYNRVLSDAEIQSLHFEESGGLTGVVGQEFNEPLGATSAAGLPPGLALDASTGAVSGVPASPGLYEVKLTGKDGIERTRQFNILRASQSTVTVDVGMVAGRLYTDYFGTTMSGGSFGLGVLPGGADYDFADKSRDQILSDFVWVNGSRVDGQLVDPVNGGQFYLPALFTSFDQDLPMFAFLSTGTSVLDGNWLLIGGPDSSWLTPDPENLFGFTAMELSLGGNRIYAGTDGWRYRNGVLVSTGDEDLGFIAPPMVTGGAVEATQSEPFSYHITASGDPTSYDARPLPPGLVIDTATGVISGAPSQRGVFDLTLFASNAGWTRSANLQLTVELGLPVVTNPGPQSAEVGAEFALQMQASNETTLYAEEGLPDGLEIDASTGLISGRPVVVGAYTVTVYATNSTGTGETTFSLDISYNEVSLAAGEISFEVIEKTLTWHQAKADAEALGGRLAVFPTGEMYDRVIAEVRRTYSGLLWLGLTDEFQEGVWRWVDGSPLTYARWHWGEPNNAGNEDYAHVWDAWRTTWNDLPASSSMPYLLERGTAALASLPWTQSGAAWTVDVTQAHDGISSAKAQTGDGVETYREHTVTGPVVVDFWWKVSSEQGFDFFSYSVNGDLQERISGEVDWNYRTLSFGEGQHTIRWTYAKDEFGSVGQDAGWIDGFATYPATSELEVADGMDVLAGEATVDFGSGGGADLSKTLSFSNKGYVPLAVTLSLPADAPFSFRDTSEKTFELYLGRGEQVPVELVMDTSTIGLKTAVLAIEAPDSTAVAPVLTLIGTALGGEITVFGPAGLINHDQAGEVDFGLAPFEAEFTIANDGNAADLDIANVQVSGNFAITKSPAASVAPGASTTFKVASLDAQPGVQLGVVTIECNDLDTPVFTFPVRSKVLLGTGNPTPGGTETSGTGGAAGWDFGATDLPGGSTGQALKTGATPDGGASVLQGVFDGPGMLTWKWKVATQQGFDWLTCEVDGVEVAGISTKNEKWQSQSIRVPAGSTVRWIYRKDATGAVGADAGYLAALDFDKFDGAPAGYNQWAEAHGSPASEAKDPKSGLPYVFGWLGGWDPATGPNTNHYRAVREGGVFKYRFPVSKTSTGSARVEFTTDLRLPVPANSWSVRGLEQTVLPGDGDHAVMEVTAPSPTRGFFRLIYSP